MPVRESHTERTLADYMLRAIDGNARILRWDFETDRVADAVADALFAYHGDAGGTIDDATNVARLERLARIAIWTKVLAAYTTHLDFTAGQTKIPRSKLRENAKAQLELERGDIARRAGMKTARIRYADVDDLETEEFEQ
jgi:hypothetical protein